MQTCTRCSEIKPLTAFEWQKARPAPRRVCKVCRYAERDREAEKVRHREYMRERRATDPDALRRTWERSVYGTTKEELGRKHCQICTSTERLVIDHDHATGAVRGILCSKCNSGLGMFKDDPARLTAAVNYLTATATVATMVVPSVKV